MPPPRLIKPLRALSTLSKHPPTAAVRTLTPLQSSQTALLRKAHHVSTRLSSSTSSSTSSVDANEVSHFNALASTWWDPHGPSRILHLMNPLRHVFITRCLSSITSSRAPLYRYLDVGCGGGIFAESAARLPHTKNVTAIDPSSEVLAIAKAHQKRDPLLTVSGKLTYLNKSIEDLAVPQTEAEQFDIVTLFEVLEHVNTPSEFLEKLMPHVKPGGWLVLSTIARTWTSWAVTNVMAEDVLRIVPKGTHDWRKCVNEAELREWFREKKGWGGMRTMGVVYVPGLGWREVPGGEGWGNYFFAVRRES